VEEAFVVVEEAEGAAGDAGTPKSVLEQAEGHTVLMPLILMWLQGRVREQ